MQRALIILLIIFPPVLLEGQYPGTFRYTDSTTYALYLEKKWPELISEGKIALQNGHDYYYMRMRLGIAFYERKNYGMSALHFNMALEFNENDPTALEYLFYSFYLSGRIGQGWVVLNKLSHDNMERVISESRIRKNSVTAETYYSKSATSEITNDPGTYFVDSDPGSQVVSKFYLNNAVYASHFLGRNISYFHAFTNLRKENFLHYYDGLNETDMASQVVIQNQYYGAINLFSSDGWSLSPAFHFVRTTYPFIYFDYSRSVPAAVEYQTASNEYAASISLGRTGGFAGAGVQGGFSELNSRKQAQAGLNLVFYPLGNSSLYFGGSMSTLLPLTGENTDYQFVTGVTAGFSLFDKVWFDVTGLDGNMSNFLGNNGLLIYNSADVLTRKISGTITVPFNKPGLTIYMGAGKSWYYSRWMPFTGSGSEDRNLIRYINNVLTGGLTWNF